MKILIPTHKSASIIRIPDGVKPPRMANYQLHEPDKDELEAIQSGNDYWQIEGDTRQLTERPQAIKADWAGFRASMLGSPDILAVMGRANQVHYGALQALLWQAGDNPSDKLLGEIAAVWGAIVQTTNPTTGEIESIASLADEFVLPIAIDNKRGITKAER